MNPVTSKIEVLEALLRALTDAAYLVLVESNGVSDNEWRVEDGKAIPQWPVESFYVAIRKLDGAYTNAHDYFEPPEAAKRQKWADACATASYIMDRLKEDRAAGKEHANMIDSHLHRNIADAINGGLIQTSEDRRAGRRPGTMTDRLNELVANGDLVEFKASDVGPST